MGIVEKFIKEGQLTKEEYPELLHLYQDPDSVRLLREEAVRIQKKYFGNKRPTPEEYIYIITKKTRV